MSAAQIDADIAIVGGGAIGLAAAAALRDAGFSVQLIERAARPAAFDPSRTDPRVYALSPATVVLLQRLGAWEAIRATRAGAVQAMHVWERDPAQAALHFDAEHAEAPLGWIVEHALLVDALWQRLDSVPLRQTRPVELAVHEVQGRVVLMLEDGSTLTARLVVAADGADSAMRRLAGIEHEHWDYAQRGIVCHVRTERPHRATAWQRFLRSGPLALLPGADGRCSIVWSADQALADELLALDEAAFCARLTEASEMVLGTVTAATPRLAFPLRALRATQVSAPGVVLVGDAAHAIHPLAGQGANLGFADVEALVAVLSRGREAGRDWSSPRSLRAYARARAADTADMLALTDGLYRGFGTRLPLLRPALGLGLALVDRMAPAKRLLAAQAIGSRS